MKIKISLIITALIVLMIGYVIAHPLSLSLCSNIYQTSNYIGCSDGTIKSIGSPLFIFMSWILPIIIFAALLRENIFRPWIRLSLWFVPLLILYIFTTPVNFTGIGLDLFPFYRDDAARLAAEIFSVASLVVMVFSFMRLRFVKEDGKGGEYQVRELKALVASSIGAVAAAIFVWTLFSNNLNLFILSGITFIAMALFSLYQIIVLVFKKRQDHLALGLKLNTAILLLTVSVIVCATSFLIGIR